MTYKHQVLVFLDILGFRSMLEDQSNLAKLYRKIKSLKKSFEVDQQTYKYNGEVLQFSDSLIITSDVRRSRDLGKFLKKVATELANLAFADIFVRGSITFGPHYYEDGILISPSLAEAFDLENKFAKYPRVIFSPTFEDRYLKHFNRNVEEETVRATALGPIFNCSKVDTDGFKYLDYLGAFFSGRDLIEELELETDEELCRMHKQIITNYMENSKDIGVLSKMAWLGNYHNSYIKNNPSFSDETRDDLLVDCNKVSFGF